MKIKLENCYYELIKELLMSYDSMIKDVQKDKNGVLVILQDGKSQDDLMLLLKKEPIDRFLQNAVVYEEKYGIF